MAYTQEIYREPFWAENSGFMTGRDPLGIQNSSVATYARLLPGMTNLTLRLRYYGFHCWLLNEYHKLDDPNLKRDHLHQDNFIRRGELLVAFIMAKTDPGQRSIVGSQYTDDHFNPSDPLDIYSIKYGADRPNPHPDERLYWDYHSGALGQYYAGSLDSLGLITSNEKFFIVLERGKKLATAFSETISPESRDLFLKVVETGQVGLTEIDELSEFNVARIPFQSAEWSFYWNMLRDDDGPKYRLTDATNSQKRFESIQLYLAYVDIHSEITFPEHCYKLVRDGQIPNSACFGWYYYFLSEVFHYCIETIFWVMLLELDGRSMPVADFMSHMTQLMVEHSLKELAASDDSSLFEVIAEVKDEDVIDKLSELGELAKSAHNGHEALGKALYLMFNVYAVNEPKSSLISEFEVQNQLVTQQGNVSQIMKSLLEKNLDGKYADVMHGFVKFIVNDHIETAYRKMGNGEVNLLKFLIEDGHVQHVQTMEPKRTSPRLEALRNFMDDLGFEDRDAGLTSEGVSVLVELRNKA